MKARDLVAYLSVLVKPIWWMRNESASRALSDFIDTKLDAGERLEITSDCTMDLCGVTLWRANYPYGYGNIWKVDGMRLETKALPRRPTAMRLRQAEIAAIGTEEDRIRLALAKATGEGQ